MKHVISSPKLKKGLHLGGMISIVCKMVWEQCEERYYLKGTSTTVRGVFGECKDA